MVINTQDYRVKTSFIPRPNGHTENAWEVGIDIGYSSVKVFAPNADIQFPSFAEIDYTEEIGVVGPNHIKYVNLKTNERWIVGASAQNSIQQSSTSYSDGSLYQRERYDTPMFAVLVDVALGLATTKNEYGEVGDLPIKIQTGLPSNYLRQDAPALKQAFVGEHHFSLQVGTQPVQEFHITLTPNDVSVMEQPMGTLMSISIDSDHKFIKEAGNYLNSSILILDGGHGTWDTFEIANNRVVAKKTFDEFSMRRVLEKTIEVIENEYGTVISPVAIQKCLETGVFSQKDGKFSSKKVPFAEILEEQNNLMFEAMINRLAETQDFSSYDYIVITGGTGYAWEKMIKEKLSQIEGLKFIDGNQNDETLPFDFANARGYYMYLYQQNARKTKSKKED